MDTGEMAIAGQPVDLDELLRTVVARSRGQWGESHAFVLDCAVDQCVTWADPRRLEQVFTNLLDNAVKYSPNGGTINVRLQAGADEGLLLSVQDHGIGLPAGAADSIFEPFGRAQNAAESGLPGTGLGLYICRRIVERHGGRMWAESAGEGLGASVFAWLPRTSGEALAPPSDSPAS
jgi:signal transduction histidine kinase